MTDLVDEVHNHIILLNAQAVEVFPHRESKVVFALAAGLSPSEHCGRVEADAAGLRQDPLSVRVREGGRGGQVVLATVGMKDVSFE